MPQFRQTATNASVPAPIGGLNTRDAVDMVGETDALRLDNFFPGRSYVQVRSGFSSHATGLDSSVESLMTYNSGSANTMFGATSSKIYDVTSAGAVGSAVVTGLSNAKFQHVNVTTSGGSFLWICNGEDAPRHYNGSTWATPTISGVTSTTIIGVEVFKERLLIVLTASLSFGYLAPDAVAGSVTTFNLGSVFRRGGKLMAIKTWTRDGGAGPDDLAVFYSDQGEVAIYSGTDPSDASKWAIVGVFHVGRPIGRRCMMTAGSDCYLITERGVVPLTQIMGTGESAPNLAITDKIQGTWNTAVTNYRTVFGWGGILYPRGNYALFNVPAGATTNFNQLVVNLGTGAWARFRGQDSYAWASLASDIYFGGSTKVYKADDGTNDAGSAIEAVAKTGFLYYGGRDGPKRFTALRPVFASDMALSISIGFDTDYRDGTSLFETSTTTSISSTWDSASWDAADWAAPISTTQAWRSVADIGWNAAVRVRTSTTEQSVRWLATDIRFEKGVGL